MSRQSPIWLISENDLRLVVKSANSLAEVLEHFGLAGRGGNYKTLQRRCLQSNIDLSQLIGAGRKKTIAQLLKYNESIKLPIENYLVVNSTYSRTHLKERLLKEGLLKNQCCICGQLPEWNGKPLSLQIDHINGIHNDNRLENLRILCPHCHSQTENFAGRNKEYKVI